MPRELWQHDYAADPCFSRCPECGQRVFKSSLKRHNTRCRAMLEAWGTPDEMLAQFRADLAVTLRTFYDRLPRHASAYVRMWYTSDHLLLVDGAAGTSLRKRPPRRLPQRGQPP